MNASALGLSSSAFLRAESRERRGAAAVDKLDRLGLFSSASSSTASASSSSSSSSSSSTLPPRGSSAGSGESQSLFKEDALRSAVKSKAPKVCELAR